MEVLVVRKDVGRLVGGMSGSMRMCKFVCVSVGRTDIVSQSWWSMSCLFPLNENQKSQHSLVSLMIEMNEKAFMSPGAFDSRR